MCRGSVLTEPSLKRLCVASRRRRGERDGAPHVYTRSLTRAWARIIASRARKGKSPRCDMHAHSRARAARQQGRLRSPLPPTVDMRYFPLDSTISLAFDRINVAIFLLSSIYQIRIYTIVSLYINAESYILD